MVEGIKNLFKVDKGGYGQVVIVKGQFDVVD